MNRHTDSPGFDKLFQILVRCQRKAELLKAAERVEADLRYERQIAEDYAQRLEEKAKFRRLLADDRLDAARFRFYFTQIETKLELDQLRTWLDGKMEKFDATNSRLAITAQAPASPSPNPTSPGHQELAEPVPVPVTK